ncbi:hypothetical protein [Methanobacterium paludis]|uniref:Uncharacterized protein n=1 Tax=Methanobacterium paludis (strain DSM 25820 / JCM 18151 / SWAN1) TaxID=868131 RepID=F6D2V5_METPW|nr:hypothetical protein [Methanobacterium paludis]AEG18684.1 hypothetical protein MSWAN_1673 [Methanobacterium paludis]
MSLDISLYKGEDGIIAMNWFRNPFGLERWAEKNVGDKVKIQDEEGNKVTLWDVCNKWCYKRAEVLNSLIPEVKRRNRLLFKEVVDAYWSEIQKLDEGFFFFDLPTYDHFVGQHTSVFPNEWVLTVTFTEKEIVIPMDYFKNEVFNLGRVNKGGLQGYKDWFKELVDFADLLQNLDYTFEGSN